MEMVPVTLDNSVNTTPSTENKPIMSVMEPIPSAENKPIMSVMEPIPDPLVSEASSNSVQNRPHGSGLVPCPVCNHYFLQLSEMKAHLEAEHRKYQCDICRKLMSHKRNVDRHRKSVHENQRGFGCPMCSYKSAHKQVVQRHLVTKHQVKREEAPNIPFSHHQPQIQMSSDGSMLDIKPLLNHPYYTNPPWLSTHDYSYYQQAIPYPNYPMMPPVGAGHVVTSDSNPQPQPQIVPQNEAALVATLQDPISVPIEPGKTGTDENANIKKEITVKKPAMTAQVSFEENHVRIVFTRLRNIHVVEVPFPDL